MFTKSVLFILLLAFACSSCCKKRVYCTAGELKIAFVGFPRGDIRAVTLKRYMKGAVDAGTLNKALDSAQLTLSSNLPVVPNKKDTIWLSSYSVIGLVSTVKLGNDWDMTLNATGEHFRFNSIGDQGHVYQIEKCSGKETACVNGISGFSSNGGWHTGDVYYIQR